MSIELFDVSKRIGASRIVEGVSLRVEEKELFVLLGASGSGKSSILRVVAGLLEPDEGRVELHGKDVTGLPPQAREVGFVFQDYSIFSHMTVAENVEFGLRVRGMERAARAARRDELLEMVELGGFGHRRPNQLSGGQLQRVALGRALAYEPRVLLLDEPFGALDVKIRAQLRQGLLETQRRLGVTTLLVTHDQDEAFELADRIGVIERGRLIEVGTPGELYARPKKGWTASFVGSGCIFLGRVNDRRAQLGPVSFKLPESSAHEEGGWVRVLVRPEQFALSETEPAVGAAVLGQGEVLAKVFAGSTTHVRLRVPRPPAVRQLSPPQPFGEEGLLVEATVPSAVAIPERPWVTLSSWHVLEQPPPRLLLLGGDGGDEPFVEWIRESLGATIARSGDAGSSPAAASQAARPTRTPRYYDLLVLVQAPDDPGDAVAEILAQPLEAPLLIVPRGSPMHGPVLVCTAVGEPGKADARVGGWLARRLDGKATLFHAWTRHGEPPDWVRRHLARGISTLRAQGADPRLVLQPARSALHGVLDYLEAEPHSLIVIGATRAVDGAGASGFASELVRASRRPVVVVPEDAM